MTHMSCSSVPTAHITIKKGRKSIKEGKFVYLQNGQEFEIELHNPTSDTVLAKISINNNLISHSGLVLRPGERVFLERYIDKPNKFKFETYLVDGSVEEIKKAIEKNGLVKVEFYKEDTTPVYSPPVIYRETYPRTFPDWTLRNNDLFTVGTVMNNNITYSSDNNTLSASMFSADMDTLGGSESILRKKSLSRKTETGRIESGSHSQQSFTTVDKKFYSYPFSKVELHIKPISEQGIDIKKMKVYCTNCGKKVKHEWKFCSNCGSQV